MLVKAQPRPALSLSSKMAPLLLVAGGGLLARAQEEASMHTEGADLIINSPKGGDIFYNGESFGALTKRSQKVESKQKGGGHGAMCAPVVAWCSWPVGGVTGLSLGNIRSSPRVGGCLSLACPIVLARLPRPLLMLSTAAMVSCVCARVSSLRVRRRLCATASGWPRSPRPRWSWKGWSSPSRATWRR